MKVRFNSFQIIIIPVDLLWLSLVLLELPCRAVIPEKHINGNAYNQFIPQVNDERTIEGIGQLTTSLLHDIYQKAGLNFNIVFSPLSVWTVLAILLDGAGGKTELELKEKLNLTYSTHEEGQKIIRSGYTNVKNLLPGDTGVTDFTSLNYIVTDRKFEPDFKNVIEQFYDGKFFTFDHRKKGLFSIMVNSWASDKSNGKLSNLISPDMLNNLVMLIGNAVFFKSKWKYPFDPKNTFILPFRNSDGKAIAGVPMMNIEASLPLGYNMNLEAEILEIPYADNVTSMVIVLPQQGLGFRTVLSRMKNLSLRQIIPSSFIEEPVQLSLPRFFVTSRMYLNEVLKQDLQSMFSARSADFPYMSKDVFVSRISHKAEIENTEEGTTASAITSVEFAYKSSSITFRADRPFIYLINEIKTRTIFFAGTFTNPSTGTTTV